LAVVLMGTIAYHNSILVNGADDVITDSRTLYTVTFRHILPTHLILLVMSFLASDLKWLFSGRYIQALSFLHLQITILSFIDGLFSKPFRMYLYAGVFTVLVCMCVGVCVCMCVCARARVSR
jgi:hypothetical protein